MFVKRQLVSRVVFEEGRKLFIASTSTLLVLFFFCFIPHTHPQLESEFFFSMARILDGVKSSLSLLSIMHL